MLQGVVGEGSGHFAQISGYTVGGKTGTSQKVDPKTGTYGATAAETVRQELRVGDYLIVKGSRGVGLDALTRKLRESLALV